MRVTYDDTQFITAADDENVGGIWDAVGAIGASAVQLIPGLFGGGGSSAGGPAKGLGPITAAVQQAISSLNQLLQAAQSGQMPPAQAVSEAQRIASALSNPQYVYQAQRGKDAEVLASGKQQAAAIVAQIQALANAPVTNTGGNTGTGTGATPVVGTDGKVTYIPAGGGGGIDSTTLLMLGGGLALILLLK